MNTMKIDAPQGLVWRQAGEDGCRVDYGVFSDHEIYRKEQEHIFRGAHWSFVALEAEVPSPGDYKTTHIGDTPVVVTRGEDNAVHVLVNRCAHRGALVCRELRGNSKTLQCVYHQWAYDLQGNLIGVPFRRGLKGEGGMPKSFEMKNHGMQRLRTECLNGIVFATFSAGVEPLQEYLGPVVVGAIQRIFRRPLEVLGNQRQYIHGNWKLYAENTRDPYHASLLHLFHTTFGLYRSTQKGAVRLDRHKRHSLLFASNKDNNDEHDKTFYKDVRTFNTEFKLQAPSLLKGRKEFDDDVSVVILSVFPNLIVQQIANTLAVRQSVTYGPNAFELVWTHFGYADDDEEMRGIRQKQANLIGPAGLISMEDGEAVEIVHRAVAADASQSSFIAMGGGRAEDSEHLVSESSIIGFWEYYDSLMRPFAAMRA